VAGFGIKVTLIEPGGYSTDWGGSSAKHATALPAYDGVREQAANRPCRRRTPGDPVATRAAVLTLVDSDEPPLREFFGDTPLAIATADYESRLATWNQWQSLSVAAHGGQAWGAMRHAADGRPGPRRSWTRRLRPARVRPGGEGRSEEVPHRAGTSTLSRAAGPGLGCRSPPNA